MKRKKTAKKTRVVRPLVGRRARALTKAMAAAKPRAKLKAKATPKAESAPVKRKAVQPDMLDAMLTAGAEALKLPIDSAWRDGVKFNLGLILRLGALVDGFDLPDDTEPGPVFHA
jgi:hypothetical protein